MLRGSADPKPIVTLLVVCLLASMLAGASFAAGTEPGRPTKEIDPVELYRLGRGGEVKGRIIQGAQVRNVLRGKPKTLRLTDCDVNGKLNLAGMTVETEIRIAGTWFRGPVNCQRTHFTKPVSFAVRGSASRFRNGANFDEAQFDRAAFFSTFRSTDTRRTREDKKEKDPVFGGPTTFRGTVFGGVALFDRAVFGPVGVPPSQPASPPFDFGRARFAGRAGFRAAEFRAAEFRAAEFHAPGSRETVSFEDVVFGDGADFSRASFECRLAFRNTTFSGAARFVRAQFGATDPDAAKDGDNRRAAPTSALFVDCTFAGPADFRMAVVGGGGLKLESCSFKGAALFDRVTGTEPFTLGGERFQGMVTFTDMDVDTLRVSTMETFWQELQLKRTQKRRPKPNPRPPEPYPPTVFRDTASFYGLTCRRLDLEGTVFRDHVSFAKAKVSEELNLRKVTFGSDVSFQNADLPSAGADKAKLKGVTFDGALYVDWKDLGEHLKETDYGPGEWAGLERAFKRAGNLKGQNESMCRRRCHEQMARHDGQAGASGSTSAPDPPDETERPRGGWFDDAVGTTSHYFWGYGVRPGRVLAFLVGVFVVGAVLYAVKFRKMNPDPSGGVLHAVKSRRTAPDREPRRSATARPLGWWHRILFGLDFSWHNSIRLGWGYRRTRDRTLRFVVFTQSLLAKGLLVFFLKALANTNPVVRELGGSLLSF